MQQHFGILRGAIRGLTVLGLGLFALTFTLTLMAAPAHAQGEFTAEAFLGYYDPDSVDDNAQNYGGRIGYRPSDRFGLLLSVGVVDLEDDLLDVNDDDIQFGLLLADLSFQWYPTGNNFYLFAGPGYSDVELELDLPGDNNDIRESSNSFTVNAGLGYRWDIGESFFIRPEAKARWFEGDDFEADEADSYDGLDTEYSIALGWRF